MGVVSALLNNFSLVICSTHEMCIILRSTIYQTLIIFCTDFLDYAYYHFDIKCLGLSFIVLLCNSFVNNFYILASKIC